MKKEAIIGAIVIILVVLGIFLIQEQVSFSPPPEGSSLPIPSGSDINLAPPNIPPRITNCSGTSIESIWNSIFIESSNGITIITNTTDAQRCEVYYVYKIQGSLAWVIAGKDENITTVDNQTNIAALYGEFTPSAITNITRITSLTIST